MHAPDECQSCGQESCRTPDGLKSGLCPKCSTVDKIYHGDCVSILNSLPAESVDLVFADPPFNIGLNYDEHQDSMSPKEYVAWTNKWLDECLRVLKPHGSIYVAIGDDYAGEMAVALKARFTMRNWLIWNFGFGQCTKKKFNRCKTHILYFVKNGKSFTWNGDAIKVPSARQTKYGDKRAKAGGKMPDDVWDIFNDDNPKPLTNADWNYESVYNKRQDALDAMPGGAQGAKPDMSDFNDSDESSTDSDVWKVSRLCGTFSERIKKDDGSVHPCQMPESLLERIIKVSSSEGDLVIDPFGGTGTTAAVAKKLKRNYTTMDRSQQYCDVIAKRLGTKWQEFVPPKSEQMHMFEDTQ